MVASPQMWSNRNGHCWVVCIDIFRQWGISIFSTFMGALGRIFLSAWNPSIEGYKTWMQQCKIIMTRKHESWGASNIGIAHNLKFSLHACPHPMLLWAPSPPLLAKLIESGVVISTSGYFAMPFLISTCCAPYCSSPRTLTHGLAPSACSFHVNPMAPCSLMPAMMDWVATLPPFI